MKPRERMLGKGLNGADGADRAGFGARLNKTRNWRRTGPDRDIEARLGLSLVEGDGGKRAARGVELFHHRGFACGEGEQCGPR